MQPSTEKITLLIVDDIPETRENLRKLLYFEKDIEIVGIASNGREAVDLARKLQPNIVLMDINMPDMDGITASEQISRAAPMCAIIMMSVQSEADYLRRSMLAGAMDFLTKPFSSEELVSSIRRVYEMGATRRATAPPPVEAGTGRPAGAPTPTRQRETGGKILLIYSPKGGTGCSSVAANLAIALHQATSKKVALIDISLQFGDLGVLLNLQANRTLADATAKVDFLDSEMLSALMSPHASGIQTLVAPPAPEVAETISTDDIKTILTLARKSFDYVIVDTWSFLDDIVLNAMEIADRILIVLVPEIPSIKSTKQFLEVAEALKFPSEQIDLILNKALPRDSIRGEQIAKSMHHTLQVELEFEPRGLRQSTNQGLPLIVSEPSHPFVLGIQSLVTHLVSALQPHLAQEVREEAEPPPEKAKRRTGLFGRMKR